eukprot:9501938-Pyramimonas_sp.AAC.1
MVSGRRRPRWVGGQVSLQLVIDMEAEDMEAEDDHTVATRTRVFDFSVRRGPKPKAGEGTGGEEAPRDGEEVQEARAGDVVGKVIRSVRTAKDAMARRLAGDSGGCSPGPRQRFDMGPCPGRGAP